MPPKKMKMSVAQIQTPAKVDQTGAPEVAEPEQHECSGETRFQDEHIRISGES